MSRDVDGRGAPMGEAGSGFARYAAAMSLYQQGLIKEETLEVFRICSPDDQLDPLQELARLGITQDLGVLELHFT